MLWVKSYQIDMNDFINQELSKIKWELEIEYEIKIG